MNPVVVRNVKIGEGIPKICVPIVGISGEDILSEGRKARDAGADMAEWRADWYEDALEPGKTEETLGKLRKILGDIPLLFTFRTLKEGGEKEIGSRAYAELNKRAAMTGNVDLIDVELSADSSAFGEILQAAHGCGVKVIASNHDFHKTPSKEDMIESLCRMQDLGADILKIAVMPQDKKDVLTLLSATLEMRSEHADRPVVTMSMSGTGVISRMCGEVFGSAITFGSAGKSSAPGQMEAADLKKALLLLHKAL